MRVVTMLRTSPALWLATVLIPVLVWIGTQNTDSVIASWTSVSAQSTFVLGFVNAACGAAAAWEAARLRQGNVLALAPARSPLAIALTHLLPVAVLGLAGIIASLAVHAVAVPPSQGYPSLGILGTAYVVVLSHMALGWLVGSRMPRILGAACMLLFGYVWGFWPAALGSMAWLRHLNGQGFIECCGLDAAPSTRSMAATVTLAVGLIAAAVLTATFRQRSRRVLASLGTFGIALVVSLTLAIPLDFDGDEPRDTALRKCTGTAPAVCLWPEQSSRQEEIARWARQATQRLKTVNVTPASQIEFGEVRPSESSVLSNVATSPLPSEPPACALSPGAKYPGSEAATVIYAWLALTGGVPEADLRSRWSPQAVALAQQVKQLPPDTQHLWYERNMRAVRDCSVKPALAPSSYAAPRADAS
ncbi:DUF7224 domain-containing protein [Streptomyces sp. NPDC000229]|uniref:DUF7224 domain-containing protein n=1 Tax=Streptomyces sp. NPDC000229 TaxID=3154247 RepID=UPI003321764F